jgi:ubiquinone/menaquinone biosynthesis C-methylase UbiE
MNFPQKAFEDYTHAEVVEANRMLYAAWSEHYNERVITDDSHTRLRGLLSTAVLTLRRSPYPRQTIRALDACGGTGNAAFILYEFGCDVTLVDVSPEMVLQFEDRCRREGKQIPAIVSDVSTFFEEVDEVWDLIVFSSALHHFRCPDKILLSALRKLTSGGLIVTVADPTINIQKMWFKVLSLIDRSLYALRKDPKNFRKALAGKLFQNRVSQTHGDSDQHLPNIGRIAEYHAQIGIDDDALVTKLSSLGYSVLLHRRYSGGYNCVFQAIYRRLKAETSFCLIVSNRKDIHVDLGTVYI